MCRRAAQTEVCGPHAAQKMAFGNHWFRPYMIKKKQDKDIKLTFYLVLY